MPTLEQGDGHFKHLGLTSVECEFPSALWHRTGGTKPILITTNITTNVSSHFPLNDNPSPTAGTYYARAQNAIHHSRIIKVIEAVSVGQYRSSVSEETRHTLGAQKSHRTL